MMALQHSINQARYVHLRSRARVQSICADYARYEARKAMWRGMHPNASPSEYEAAMRAIAKECGV
jgi:hypothetical protein